MYEIVKKDCKKDCKGIIVSIVGGLLIISGIITKTIGEEISKKSIMQTIYVDENGNPIE